MHFADRFKALDQFLTEHQALWRPRPFYNLSLDWEHTHPELAAWLRSQDLAHAEQHHTHPQHLKAPAPFNQWAAKAHALTEVEALQQDVPQASEPTGVPGRKWQQIQAFASALRFNQAPTHYLDWCAGKGHLGRHLAQHSAALTLAEYDPYLVEQGALLSQKQRINATHLCQDVLHPSAARLLSSGVTPVALHACGDLHSQLIRLAASQQCQQLAIAPCCYNRISASHYAPLSAAGQSSKLQLSIEDLALPLSETVTAGSRVRRQRDQSMAWRLGFDLLQRQVRGTNQYLPTPSLPSHWLNTSFKAFCEHLAHCKGLSLPTDVDWESLEAQGLKRLSQVRNLELVRALFRRPMELWLVLDKALYLEEHGYQVNVGTFCEHSLSPRNLLLCAERL